MITYNFLGVDNSIVDQSLCSLWLKRVIQNESKSHGELNFILCNDEYLLRINQAYLQHDTLTDIITFPTTDFENIVSGDIYISVERVKENANQLGLSFEQELSRVMVHGILHLVGYNDKTKKENLEMRAKEDYYLNLQP